MTNLGQNIKRYRQARNMTLEEVAKLVGVSRQTLSRYETGVIGNIPSDKVEAIAKALHTTPACLMGWEIEIHNSDTNKEAVTEDGDSLSEDELELIKYYRQLSPERKEDSKIQLKALVERAVQRSEDKK